MEEREEDRRSVREGGGREGERVTEGDGGRIEKGRW